MVLLCLSGAYFLGYRVNVSESMSIGIWHVKSFDRPIRRDDIVWFCPPDKPVFQLAKQRQYIPIGACPGAYAHLLKRVTGIPGDQIIAAHSGSYVNRHRIKNSRPQSYDSSGRPMTPHIGVYTLKSGLWLIADNTGSFDSRYFGPLSIDIEFLQATPILTLK